MNERIKEIRENWEKYKGYNADDIPLLLSRIDEQDERIRELELTLEEYMNVERYHEKELARLKGELEKATNERDESNELLVLIGEAMGFDQDAHPDMLVETARRIKSLEDQLYNDRCEHCGAKISHYSHGCPLCGAPQCCQQCCKIEHYKAELSRAREALKPIREVYLAYLNDDRAIVNKGNQDFIQDFWQRLTVVLWTVIKQAVWAIDNEKSALSADRKEDGE